jgi:hypothetical protein
MIKLLKPAIKKCLLAISSRLELLFTQKQLVTHCESSNIISQKT